MKRARSECAPAPGDDDDDTSTTAQPSSPKRLASAATHFLAAARHCAPGPLVHRDCGAGEYELGFHLLGGVTIFKAGRGSSRARTTTTTRPHIALFDVPSRTQHWRALHPEATFSNHSTLDVATFQEAAESSPSRRRKSEVALATLLDEYRGWVGGRTTTVIVACRAGHERSSAATLLAHRAFALAAGDMDDTQHRHLASTLEPRRVCWDLGVMALSDMLGEALRRQ